ncbi:MAG: WXG100 family type VII secretion target [Nocardioides sp.]
MSNVNVTYEEMRSSASQLRNGQEQMNSTLTELSQLINNLVQTGFVTDLASVTYQDHYEQFTNGTRQAIDALESLAAYLEQAADTLAATDSDLANAIQG